MTLHFIKQLVTAWTLIVQLFLGDLNHIYPFPKLWRERARARREERKKERKKKNYKHTSLKMQLE